MVLYVEVCHASTKYHLDRLRVVFTVPAYKKGNLFRLCLGATSGDCLMAELAAQG